MNTSDGPDLAALMPHVAKALWGDPNPQLTDKRNPRKLYFGKRGSLVVDLDKGTFYDHEREQGGGSLHAIDMDLNLKGREAYAWMEEQGLINPREMPERPQHQRKDHQDRSSRPQRQGERVGPVVKRYVYDDLEGKPRYRVNRHEPGRINEDGTPAESKTFRQDHYAGGDFRNGLPKTVARFPYHVRALVQGIKEGRTVYVPEGEKDVETLEAMGLVATTNAGGSKKWLEELNVHFAGANVVLIQDNDSAGRAHVATVGLALRGVAKSVRVLDMAKVWSACPEKGDVTDWKVALGVSATGDAFLDAVQAHARPWTPERPKSSMFDSFNIRDLFKEREARFEWLVKGVLVRKEMLMIAGPSGVGKSFEAMELIISIATGADYRGHKVRHRGGVIYQAGEGGAGIIDLRLMAQALDKGWDQDDLDDMDIEVIPDGLDLFNGDDPVTEFIRYCQGLAACMTRPLEVVVIDTLSSVMQGADENSSKDVSLIRARARLIGKTLNCAVIVVHHMNASGEKERGHTSIRADIESVMRIKDDGDTTDEKGRQVRIATMFKQKDGASTSWQYVLESVKVGVDEDGEPITSCVPRLVTVDGKAKEEGFRTSNARILQFISCMNRAHQKVRHNRIHGNRIPGGVMSCTTSAAVRDEWWAEVKAGVAYDEKDPIRVAAAKNKAGTDLNYCRTKLLEEGVIGITSDPKRENFLWFTGKKIAGQRFYGQGSALPDSDPADHAIAF